MKNGKEATFLQRSLASSIQVLGKTEPQQVNNRDEERYKDNGYVGSFTKLLQHDANGILTAEGRKNYEILLKAVESGSQDEFNKIQRANREDQPSRVFINPQAAQMITLKGSGITYFTMPPAPAISSAEAAAEILEVYLYVLCADVNFTEYGTGENSDSPGWFTNYFPNQQSITKWAADILTKLGDAYKGPKNDAFQVTPDLLFRGKTRGDKNGPYISQFLLHPFYPLFPSGCAPFVGNLIGVGELNQKYLLRKQVYPVANAQDFGYTRATFAQIQDGFVPEGYSEKDYGPDLEQNPHRHLINGRDLGSLVHIDNPYEASYNALNILVYRDAPRSPVFPYNNGKINNEGDGHSMGIPDAYTLIGDACIEGFKAAWYQKWRVHRRLRPEAMAGLVDLAARNGFDNLNNTYNLHESLFREDLGRPVLELMKERPYYVDGQATERPQINLLLPLMYPEGSPAHPAYPSGHATVIGACTTVLKALFNESFKMTELLGRSRPYSTPVIPDPQDGTELIEYTEKDCDRMTVGSELDKLASNIALGRNFGTVHYRADGDEGIRLGEKVAMRLLQDRARTYTEDDFQGFQFSDRDGCTVKITADKITVDGVIVD